MYHLRSRKSVYRFNLVSWMLVFRWLMSTTACVMLLWSVFAIDKLRAEIAACLLVATLPVALAEWCISPHACCPVCLTPPVSHRRCSTNHRARKLLGSYQLRVAVSIIVKQRFRCPYCGEATAIDTRPDSTT